VRRRHRRLPQQEADRHPEAVSGGHDGSVSLLCAISGPDALIDTLTFEAGCFEV
jgi:hypothetical protein